MGVAEKLFVFVVTIETEVVVLRKEASRSAVGESDEGRCGVVEEGRAEAEVGVD